MLYWFRTPPGVKVGRAALDEDAIRLIEQLNPGMEFDWPRILKGQGSPATEPRPLVEARRQRPDNRRSQPHTPAPSRPVPRPPAVEPERPQPDLLVLPMAGESAVTAEPALVREAVEVPAADIVAAVAAVKDEVPTPAHARLGAEGVQQLRARYADLLARISERPDETRRAELKQQADRLNPDSWVTGDQVAQGLEQYESVLASLREVAGQNRRRRRRGKGPRPAGPGGGPGGGNAAGPEGGDQAVGPEAPAHDSGDELDSVADGDSTSDES